MSKYPVMTAEAVKEAVRKVVAEGGDVAIQALVSLTGHGCHYRLDIEGDEDHVILDEGVKAKTLVCAVGAWFHVNGIREFDDSGVTVRGLLQRELKAATKEDEQEIINLQHKHDAAAKGQIPRSVFLKAVGL